VIRPKIPTHGNVLPHLAELIAIESDDIVIKSIALHSPLVYGISSPLPMVMPQSPENENATHIMLAPAGAMSAM
jgi:hypothetical protein